MDYLYFCYYLLYLIHIQLNIEPINIKTNELDNIRFILLLFFILIYLNLSII